MARIAERLPVFDAPPPARSDNMRAIRGRGNKTTEWRARALMMREGLRGWAMKTAPEIGSPDFLFRAARVAVFVDGCFWHGCPRCGHVPKTNVAYWKAKLGRNRRRDKATTRRARAYGFRVVRIWECTLTSGSAAAIRRIKRALRRV